MYYVKLGPASPLPPPPSPKLAGPDIHSPGRRGGGGTEDSRAPEIYKRPLKKRKEAQ